jgi:hypothetical protein
LTAVGHERPVVGDCLLRDASRDLQVPNDKTGHDITSSPVL